MYPVTEKRWEITTVLGERYALDIIRSLYAQPKRYVELSSACSNGTTRTDRLRKLIGVRLVTTTTKKVGKRMFVHYKLTNKGKTVFEQIQKIEER